MRQSVAEVLNIITRVGAVPPMAPDRDIYEAGFSSVSSLELLLELENVFQVSIPDDRFILARTPNALLALVTGLQVGAA
jgi:acyl carrier protein